MIVLFQWEVAAKCLDIFHVFLDQFQVNEQDLEETVNSPAYHLLTQLLNDTPLLVKVSVFLHIPIFRSLGFVSWTLGNISLESGMESL